MVERTGQLAAGEAAGAGQLVAGEAVGAGQLVAGEAAGAGQLVAGEATEARQLVPGEAVGAGQLVAGEAVGAGQPVAGEATGARQLFPGEAVGAGQLVAGEAAGAGQLVAGEAAGATARPVLDLSVSYVGSSCSLEIEDKQLATEVIRDAVAEAFGALICMKIDSIPFVEVTRGICIGTRVAGVAGVVYFWKENRESTERAVREALEERPAAGAHAPDPEVREISEGSLLVKLRCHTAQSLLQFISDYESQKVKRRLEKELSKVGFKEELTITIENKEEVEEQKNKLRYVSLICEQKS